MVRTEQPPGHDVLEIRHCHTLRTTIGELKKAASTAQDRKRAGCRRSECHASGGLEVSSMSWTSTITDIRSSAIFSTALNRPPSAGGCAAASAGGYGPSARCAPLRDPDTLLCRGAGPASFSSPGFEAKCAFRFGTYSSVEGDIDRVTVLTSEEEGTTVTRESRTLR